MEIINMIFSLICSLIVSMLYHKSLVNNLFNFDLNKKLVLLKNKKEEKKIDIKINNIILQRNKYEKKENFKIKKTLGKMNNKRNLYVPKFNEVCYDKSNKSSRRILSDLRKNSYINHASTIIEENNDKKSVKEVVYNNYQLNRFDNNLENGKNTIKKYKQIICVFILVFVF